MKKCEYQLIIIGGGPAGMMAAVSAAEEAKSGNEILLIEKNRTLGRKLLATGNGRCNFTNKNAVAGDYENDFVLPTMEKMSPDRLIRKFRTLGILAREEGDGRMYPYSGQGAAVCEALERQIHQRKIGIHVGDALKHITLLPQGKKFQLTLESGEKFFCERLLLAVGGKAGEQYGCVGEGYLFAEKLGHTIVKPRPALVAVNSGKKGLKEWKGIRAKGRVSLWKDEIKIAEEEGEIQFTDSGLSGICVFNLTKNIRYSGTLKEGKPREKYKIKVDFLPECTREEVKNLLLEQKKALAEQRAENLLSSIIHLRGVKQLLLEAGISETQKIETIEDKKIDELARLLKEWTAEITGTKSWKDAQVTAGGVSTQEVNPDTLESKLVEGLYFAGELLDVDGLCGGYNLQWAFASGSVAGQVAAKNCNH